MLKVFEKGIQLPDSLWCWEWRIARIYDLMTLQVDWGLAFGLIKSMTLNKDLRIRIWKRGIFGVIISTPGRHGFKLVTDVGHRYMEYGNSQIYLLSKIE